MAQELTTYRPKTAVELRREMADNPVVFSGMDPVEKAIFLSSTAKTFAEYESPDLVKDLTKALRFIFKDTGYRSTDESELGYLVIRVSEILKRYYAGLTLKDFRMAFEMSITGELDDYLPKGRDGQADRGHYQQFNAEYVCKILNAYKGRRASVMKKANDAVPKADPMRDPDAEKHSRNLIRQQLILCYNLYVSSGTIPEISPIGEMLYYEFLADAGLAEEIAITIEEQKQIFQRTMNHYARNGMVGDMRRLEKAGTDAPEIQQKAFKLSRRKALDNAFARMREQNIKITDYIKFE